MPGQLISLCLTTYNRASTLNLTIESILSQTYTNFELIISDDNSSDNTKEVCESYIKKDSRVKYFRNETNLKMPGNLNAAIMRASGEYIANLHDGDLYRSDIIEKWYSVLSKYPDALFVFNQYKQLDSHGNEIAIYDHKLDEVNPGYVLMEYYLRTLTSAPWGTVMARKAAYETNGYFNKEYGFISDVEMWLRLGLAGKVCYVNEPLIDLTPREKDHPYFLPHWRIFLLQNIIMLSYYPLYIKEYPDLKLKFPVDVILTRIQKDAIRNFLILIKHRSVSRVREGLLVFASLPFKTLRTISKLLRPFRARSIVYYEDVDKFNNIITEFVGK